MTDDTGSEVRNPLARGKTVPAMPDARASGSDHLVLESCANTWLFDEPRRRFRRVPRGTELAFAGAEGWEPYERLVLEPDDRSFSVVLNEAGTRLLRSTRHTDPCEACGEAVTTELRLADIASAGQAGDSEG